MSNNHDAEAFYASLTPAEVLARCQAAATHNDADMKMRKLNGKVGRAHIVQKEYKLFVDTAGRHLHKGLLAAEALIRAKGGIVPVRQDFWDYLDDYITAQDNVSSETA